MNIALIVVPPLVIGWFQSLIVLTENVFSRKSCNGSDSVNEKKSWHWNFLWKSQINHNNLRVASNFLGSRKPATVDDCSALPKNSFISYIDTLGDMCIAINISLRSELFCIWDSTILMSPFFDEFETIIYLRQFDMTLWCPSAVWLCDFCRPRFHKWRRLPFSFFYYVESNHKLCTTINRNNALL